MPQPRRPLIATPTRGQNRRIEQASQFRPASVAHPPSVVDHLVRKIDPPALWAAAPIRSRSTFTGSFSSVSPVRRLRRPTCVSTTTPEAIPNATPSTTLAVLRPTPASATSSSSVPGDLAAVFLHEVGAARLDVLRLVAEETGALDVLLEPLDRQPPRGPRRWGSRRTVFGDLVDPLVGALGREDRRHQELNGRLEAERALGVGVVGLQAAEHAAGLGLPLVRVGRRRGACHVPMPVGWSESGRGAILLAAAGDQDSDLVAECLARACQVVSAAAVCLATHEIVA